jgi:ankyrin repeat protein
MHSRIALLLIGLLVTHVIKADDLPARPDCKGSSSSIRAMYLHGALTVEPAIARLEINAIDGKLVEVREQLGNMSHQEAEHWRQVALFHASDAGHAAVVDGLLTDGASVDGKTQMPHLKDIRGMLNAAVASEDSSSTEGLNNSDWTSQGSALLGAASCGNRAVVDVLLRHHADPNTPTALRENSALFIATLLGYERVTGDLLNYGSDPCITHLPAEFSKHGGTLATLGRRSGLSDRLVDKLICHRPLPVQRSN